MWCMCNAHAHAQCTCDPRLAGYCGAGYDYVQIMIMVIIMIVVMIVIMVIIMILTMIMSPIHEIRRRWAGPGAAISDVAA